MLELGQRPGPLLMTVFMLRRMLVMGLGMLVWLPLIAAVVAGVVLLLQVLFGRGAHDPKNRNPSPGLAVLNERFARGEIDRDEFEERRSVLTSSLNSLLPHD